jgi:cytochrome P450 family 12
MMIRNFKVLSRDYVFLKRNFSAQAAVAFKPKVTEYDAVKNFEEMPTLSKFELLKRFMPGGKFHQKSMLDSQKMLREELGTIYRMPGLFGQTPLVTTFDAEDIEHVHRNEGAYPYRRGMETLKYFREKVRPDLFDVGGLIVE